MIPHVRRVYGNVQGARDVALAPHTLLLGPTESGKDATVRGLEFALSGTIRDVALRDVVALPAELMAVAPGRRGTLWAEAEVVLANGDVVTARHSMEGDTASASKPTSEGSTYDADASMISLRAIKDALRSSEAGARAFFLRAVVGAVEDVESRIPKVLRARFARGLELSGKTGTDPIARLAAVAVTAKEQAKEAKALVKASDATLAGLAGLGARPTSAQIQNAQRATREATENVAKAARAEQIARAASSAPKRSAVLAEIEQAKTSQQKWADKLQALRDAPPTVGGPSEDLVQRRRRGAALRIVAGQQQARPAGAACVVCGKPTDPEEIAGRLVKLEEAVAKVEEQIKGAAGDATAKARWEEEVAQATAQSAGWGRKVARLEGVLSTIPDVAAAPDGLDDVPTLDAARAALEAAQRRQTELAALDGRWASMETARANKTQAEVDALEWGQLLEACDEASRELMREGLDAFCARVQQYLPADHIFDLRLRDGTRDVFQLGLVRTLNGDPAERGSPEGVLHTVLSGSTSVRVHCALAAALAPTDRLAVILADDRGRDAAELATSMEALGKAPCQVILMSTVEPERVPSGWHVVRFVRGAEAPVLEAAAAPPTGKTGKTGKKGGKKGKPAAESPAVPSAPAPKAQPAPAALDTVLDLESDPVDPVDPGVPSAPVADLLGDDLFDGGEQPADELLDPAADGPDGIDLEKDGWELA